MGTHFQNMYTYIRLCEGSCKFLVLSVNPKIPKLIDFHSEVYTSKIYAVEFMPLIRY